MEDSTTSKRKVNEKPSMLTPPTPGLNSFSQVSSSSYEKATIHHQNQNPSPISISRVTPPSTTSPLKHPRDTISPERQALSHDGITSFPTADPPVADLLAAPPTSLSSHRERPVSSATSPRPTSADTEESEYRNDTIVNTIRELGYRKYVQLVNRPECLPRYLRASPATPASTTPVMRASAGKKAPALRKAPAAKKAPASEKAIPRSGTIAQTLTSQNAQKKRRLSELEADGETNTTAFRVRNPVDNVEVQAQGPVLKKAKMVVPPTPLAGATAVKGKNKKPGKKTIGAGTGKAEKSRTKLQRWGDYLKHFAGGEKDAYHKFPNVAVPPLGHLIDRVPVRTFTHARGKVQDYGDGNGLHAREMELAHEVGLSYNAYRQQKRMVFVGYAAMQLEGKREFKRSHAQIMCNIDGNKSSYLWEHFHECWRWMPETPNTPISMSSLGGLELPDLQVAVPQ